ncbi:MAG TPA: hypothetical protein VGL72_24540 [Bryobacteraceae bacterium]|jgi:hypothetical protein
MRGIRQHFLIAGAILSSLAVSAFAIESTPIIVTAQAPKDAQASAVGQHDVVANVGHQPANVTNWRALRDDPAGLELWILIDDGTNSRVGIQFNDIRDFIRQQPPQIKVGVGYLQYGAVKTAQKPTTDHEAAAKSVRLPTAMPGISASPYIALADFLHHLPKLPAQPREVILISSGIDPYYGPGPQNPYLETAIQDSQKAGVPVQTIYFSSAGRAGHRYWLIDWGQNDLSQLSDETGGRFYWEGTSNPIAFKPFFDDLNRRIAEQYVMRLDTASQHKGFEPLNLKTESPGIKLVGPAQVHTP